MEGFFGLLKKEFWHGRDWSDWTPARFIEELGGWIGRYNTERRSDALGGRTPAEFRSTGKGRVTVQEIVRSPHSCPFGTASCWGVPAPDPARNACSKLEF